MWTLVLEDYLPVSTNRLLTAKHWSVAHRLKKEARDRVAVARLLAGPIPDATGRRRVSVEITMAGKGRPLDPDNAWKGILDACVSNRLLMDDSLRYCELGPVTVDRARGAGKRTTITLEDV